LRRDGRKHCAADGVDYDERIEDILLLPETLRKRAPWLNLACVLGAHGAHLLAMCCLCALYA
jgi:hypothetical protein